MPVVPYKHDFFALFLNFWLTTGELTFSFFHDLSIVISFIYVIFATENLFSFL